MDVELPQVTWQGLGLGVLAIVVAALAGMLVRLVVRSVLLWRGRGPASASVFGRLASWLCVLVGILAALTIVFPSVRPVDILGGVGVVSIAAGIAFQTVLGNMFAGIVLLARDRYRVGDQVAVDQHRGTIVDMGLTSASIRTFDGRLLLVPNVTLHSQIVTVQTGFEEVRTTVALDVDDAVDLLDACRVAEEAMDAEPTVASEPAPRAVLCAVGTTTVRIELRFWSASPQLETIEATHRVIAGVLGAYAREGIRTGSDVIVIEPGNTLQRFLRTATAGSSAGPREDGPA